MVKDLLKELLVIEKSDKNIVSYEMGANLKVISVLLILKDNSYTSLSNDINPDDIKIIVIKNQFTEKVLSFNVNDIKSFKIFDDYIKINRYKLSLLYPKQGGFLYE